VTHTHAGEPWSEHYFKDSDLFKAQRQRVLVLRGSTEPWRILSLVFDSSAQRVELLAEPVTEQLRLGLGDRRCEHRRRMRNERGFATRVLVSVSIERVG
jgi:hypothetical protein